MVGGLDVAQRLLDRPPAPPRLGFTQAGQLLQPGVQTGAPLCVVRAAVEKRQHLIALVGVGGNELHDLGRATVCADLFGQRIEGAGVGVGQEVGAVAQQGAAQGLEGTPDAHPHGGGLRGQGQ